MTRPGLLLGAFALTAVAVAVCMAYVDRPLALWVEAHVRHTALYDWVSRAFGVLLVAMVALYALLFWSGFQLLRGRTLGPALDTPLVLAWSGVWALAAALSLKEVVGRTNPDPMYVVDHIYEFKLMRGYGDFPSATTAIAAALLAVLWVRSPARRISWIAALVLVGAALAFTNNHWLSDVIGGGFLGWTIGLMTEAILRAKRAA